MTEKAIWTQQWWTVGFILSVIERAPKQASSFHSLQLQFQLHFFSFFFFLLLLPFSISPFISLFKFRVSNSNNLGFSCSSNLNFSCLMNRYVLSFLRTLPPRRHTNRPLFLPRALLSLPTVFLSLFIHQIHAAVQPLQLRFLRFSRFCALLERNCCGDDGDQSFSCAGCVAWSSQWFFYDGGACSRDYYARA